MRPVQNAGGQVHVAALNRIGDFINADLPAGQRLGIELGVNRILLRPEHAHLRHAAHHGDALRHQRFGVFVHIGKPQGRRAQRQIQNRLVGRIHLLIRRRAGQILRQVAGRLRNHGLHVLRRRVQIAAQIELQRDLRGALRTRRGHRVHAGDGGELFLQRHRHRRGHGVRSRARQAGGNQDGGKIHVGQVAHRKQAIAHDAEHQNAQHDQGGHDRAANEDFGNVHDVTIRPWLRGALRGRRRDFLQFDLGDARHQPQLPVRDHLFARGESLCDDRLPVVAAIDGHRTGLDRHVRLDHKNELSLLSVLDAPATAPRSHWAAAPESGPRPQTAPAIAAGRR